MHGLFCHGSVSIVIVSNIILVPRFGEVFVEGVSGGEVFVEGVSGGEVFVEGVLVTCIVVTMQYPRHYAVAAVSWRFSYTR